MKILRRLVDLGLLVLLLNWGHWIYTRVEEGASFFYLCALFFNQVYYSLLLINLVAVLLFGLLSFFVLLRPRKGGIYWQRAAAETGYFFVGLILLVGFFRWLLVSGGEGLADPLWVTFVLLWLMFGAWFWFSKTVERSPFGRIGLGIYGLSFLLMLPLGASAFSYGVLTHVPPEISPVMGDALVTGGGLFFLFFLRFYAHALKKFRRVIG